MRVRTYIRVVVFLTVAILLLAGCREKSGGEGGASVSEQRTPPAAPGREDAENAGLPGPGFPYPNTFETVLTIRDIPVSLQEFLDVADAKRPFGPDVEQVVLQVLRETIANNFIYMHLSEAGVRPSVLNRYEERYRSDGWLGSAYWNKVKREKLAISDPELRAVLPARFLRIEASEIVVDSRSKAEEILRRLAGGEAFEVLAREKSFSPSAESGGKLKIPFYSGSGSLYGEAVDNVLFRVGSAGVIPQVVETPMGYTVFRIDRMEPMSAEERDALIESRNVELVDRKRRNFLRELRDRTPFAVDQAALNKSASSPADHLDEVVAHVGKTTVPFGLLVAHWNVTKGRNRPYPADGKGWERELMQVEDDLLLKEEAVRQGMIGEDFVRESFRRLRKSILVRDFLERKFNSYDVTDEEVRAAGKAEVGGGDRAESLKGKIRENIRRGKLEKELAGIVTAGNRKHPTVWLKKEGTVEYLRRYVASKDRKGAMSHHAGSR